MKASPFKQTEAQIQQAIIGLLRFKGYYVQRMNSGMLPMGEGRSRRLIRMNRAGTPDIMAFRGFIHTNVYCDRKSVDILFIEVKRPGLKATPLQIEVMKELEEHGAKCIVAHSVEEVEDIL